jgi:serine O-acetyltransferase
LALLRQLVSDAMALARGRGGVSARSLAEIAVEDGFAVLATQRLRQAARRWHVPFANRALRLVQMTFYNIEIAKDARLGDGVNFVHTLGTVIGGDARIGAGTVLLGSITIGNLNDRGYPSIGEGVIIGAGARILGPITIGDGAKIGANAVVTVDVPAGATAVGVPAVIRLPATNGNRTERTAQ